MYTNFAIQNYKAHLSLQKVQFKKNGIPFQVLMVMNIYIVLIITLKFH